MAFPKDFQAVLDQVKTNSPDLSYQARLKLAGELYRQNKAVDLDNLPTAPVTAPVIVAKVVDADSIVRKVRSIAGKAHIDYVMMNDLAGLSPKLVIDGKDGVNTLCHIVVQGQRIPDDPGDFFKYFG